MNLVSALQLLILFVVIGQFGRIEFGGSNVVLYVQDLLCALILVLWVIDRVLKRRRIIFPFAYVLLILFFGAAVLSLFWNALGLSFKELMISALYFIRFVTYSSLLFVTSDIVRGISNLEDQKKLILRILNTLIFSALGLAILGFIQYVLFPDFSAFVLHGWDPHYYRILSTFFDPNFTGAYLTLGLIVALTLVILARQLQINKTWYLIPALILLLAVALTFSRSTYLAMIAGLGFLGFWQSRRLFFLGIVAGLLAFMLIPRVHERVLGAIQIDQTAQFRIEAWGRGWQIAKDHQPFGVGYNAFRFAQKDFGFIAYDDTGGHSGAGTDSSFLLILATTGVVGFLLFSLFYVFSFLQSVLALWTRAITMRYAVALMTASSLIMMFFHSQFVNSLLYPWIMLWLWVLMGIMYSQIPVHGQKKI